MVVPATEEKNAICASKEDDSGNRTENGERSVEDKSSSNERHAENADEVVFEDDEQATEATKGSVVADCVAASPRIPSRQSAPVGMAVLRSLPLVATHAQRSETDSGRRTSMASEMSGENLHSQRQRRESEVSGQIRTDPRESEVSGQMRTDPRKGRSRARCCSYRVFKTIVLSAFLTVLLLFVVLFIGSRVERRRMEQAPSTLTFYTTPAVCTLVFASNGTNATSTFLLPNATDDQQSRHRRALRRQARRHLEPGSREEGILALTMPSIDNATQRAAEYARENKTLLVAHCGDCGHCSNARDIGIYNATKNNLTDSAKMCGARSLIYGRRTAWRCLDREVGFTPGCNDCWVENIMCDLRRCFFLCTWNAIFGQSRTDEDGRHILNPCTECDEKRCGPDFIRCAGANRRRSAIISDIDRDEDSEVCKVAASPGWWNDVAFS